jgi:hypothetical protein
MPELSDVAPKFVRAAHPQDRGRYGECLARAFALPEGEPFFALLEALDVADREQPGGLRPAD